jgi:hypothetical protein
MKTVSLSRQFVGSAGVLLLATTLVMFVSLWSGRGLIHPHEPLLGMSLPEFFFIVGGFVLAVALICLFRKNTFLQTVLVLWLAVNFAIYQAGLWQTGASAGFKGYLGDVSAAFGISTGTADTMLKTLILYFLVGSLLSLLWLWLKKESGESLGTSDGHLKISCPVCGGHIAFSAGNLGQKVLCPHCQKETTLRKPGLLKMSCYFCREHIEFPQHAIGTKMPCPHCKMDITLKEPI